MDKPIFSVCVYNWRDDTCGPTADIDLPATEYEIKDALQKVRDGETMVSVESFGDFLFLRSHIGEGEDLRALNALTEKLAALEGWQVDALEGLVRMDEKKGVEINLPRLYDLASSVDDCQVLYDINTYEALGRFYAENDFVPEAEEVPDAAWELLDFGKIGRREAERENCALIGDERAFVILIGDISEKFKELDLTPKEPDYAALLEVGIADSGETFELKLPCEHKDLDNTLSALHANSWSELTWRCADCRIPALRDAFSQEDDIGYANLAARRLTELPAEDFLPYKALVEASQCSYLADAMKLLDSMDEFTFTRSYAGPEDVALDELSFLLSETDRESLIPFVNLWKYGKKLIEVQNISMTPYGGIERKDRQPIQADAPEQKSTGMEMML